MLDQKLTRATFKTSWLAELLSQKSRTDPGKLQILCVAIAATGARTLAGGTT